MGSEVSSQKGSSEKKKGQNKAKSEKSAIRNDDKLNQDQFNRRRRSSSIEFDQSFNIDSGLTKPIGGPSTSTTTKPNHGMIYYLVHRLNVLIFYLNLFQRKRTENPKI